MTDHRCLIVANQTLGSKALDRSVQDCILRETRLFYVVVPATPVDCEAVDWHGGFLIVGGAAPDGAAPSTEYEAGRGEASSAEARRRAHCRLDLMLGKIRQRGGDGDGEVGAVNPLEAVRGVLEREAPFEEIIVSTLPVGLSRWLLADLPNQVTHVTEVPVASVVTQD